MFIHLIERVRNVQRFILWIYDLYIYRRNLSLAFMVHIVYGVLVGHWERGVAGRLWALDVTPQHMQYSAEDTGDFDLERRRPLPSCIYPRRHTRAPRLSGGAAYKIPLSFSLWFPVSLLLPNSEVNLHHWEATLLMSRFHSNLALIFIHGLLISLYRCIFFRHLNTQKIPSLVTQNFRFPNHQIVLSALCWGTRETS